MDAPASPGQPGSAREPATDATPDLAALGFDERILAWIDRSPCVVYVAPSSGGPPIVVASQIEKLLGYPASEWTGRPDLWSGLLHPDDRERVEAERTRSAQKAKSYDLEYRFLARDGRTVWVRDQCYAVDEDGQPLCRQGVLIDITSSKDAEETLRESELRYRTLVEQLPAVVYMESNDFDSRNLYTSPQVQALFGVKPSDADSWDSVIHPADLDRVHEAWRTSVETGEPFSSEYRVSTPNGERWAAERAVLLRDAGGAPRFWQGVVHDVTDEKLAHQKLEDSEAKYRALVENIPAVVYIVAPDGDGTTLYVNPQVERVLGYERDEWLDQPDIWMELLHPDDREPTLAAYDHHNETGEPWSREYRLTSADGQAIWFRDEARLVRDADGDPLFWQGVRLDVTPQKLAEEALRLARDELELRVRERTTELEEANELMKLEVLERRRAEGIRREVEERYRHLIERIPAVTYVWEVGGEGPGSQNYTSPQIEAMVGFTPEEWNSTADFWLDRVHPDDRGRVSAATLRSESLGEPFREEYRYLARNGNIVWVLDECVLRSRHPEDGKPWLFEGIVIDITEERERRELLRETEERYRSLVEQIPAIVYIESVISTDPLRSRLTYISPQSDAILGHAPEQLLAEPDHIVRMMRPNDVEGYREADARAEATGEPFFHEYRVFRRGGELVWMQSRAVLVRDEDGTPRFWHGLAIDVTERRRTEEELRDIEAKFDELTRAAREKVAANDSDSA